MFLELTILIFLINFKLLSWNIKNLSCVIFFKRAQAVLQAVTAVQASNAPISGTTVSESAVTPAQSPVLRIIIDNMYYPVTLDVLHQVSQISLQLDLWLWETDV